MNHEVIHYDENDPIYKHILEVVLRNRRAQTNSKTPTAAINPEQIGREARAYIEAERKAGREVSATQAVQHVMAQGAR